MKITHDIASSVVECVYLVIQHTASIDALCAKTTKPHPHECNVLHQQSPYPTPNAYEDAIDQRRTTA